MNSSAETTALARAQDARPHVGVRGVQVVEIDNAAEWQGLLAAVPQPHLTQSHAYGEGKRHRGWATKRLLFLEGDRPVALCQVLQWRPLGSALLSRVNRGPVFFSPAPAPDLLRRVYRVLAQALAGWWHPLMLAPALPGVPASYALLGDTGFRLRRERGWRSLRVDLTQPEEEIRAGFAGTFRNRLRAAERSGLQLRIGNDDAVVEWMIERHTENMRRKGFKAADAGFIRAMREAAGDDYLVYQALQDGLPVAGMAVVRYGQIAEYHTGWFGPQGRKANSGNFLMWAIIRESKRRGCTAFDAGGLYDGHGYTQFKTGLRGEEYSLAGEWLCFG